MLCSVQSTDFFPVSDLNLICCSIQITFEKQLCLTKTAGLGKWEMKIILLYKEAFI